MRWAAPQRPAASARPIPPPAPGEGCQFRPLFSSCWISSSTPGRLSITSRFQKLAHHLVAAAREALRPGGIFLPAARHAVRRQARSPPACAQGRRNQRYTASDPGAGGAGSGARSNISRIPRQSRFLRHSVAARLSLLARPAVLDLIRLIAPTQSSHTRPLPSTSGGDKRQARSAGQILPHLRQRGQTRPNCPSPPSGGRGPG